MGVGVWLNGKIIRRCMYCEHFTGNSKTGFVTLRRTSLKSSSDCMVRAEVFYRTEYLKASALTRTFVSKHYISVVNTGKSKAKPTFVYTLHSSKGSRQNSPSLTPKKESGQ